MIGRFTNWLEHWLAPASRFANGIGVSMIIVLTILTVYNVLQRAIIGDAFTPMKELSEYALSILVFLTLPYCAIKGAHIVIDIFTMHLSHRTQAMVESVVGLLSLAMCALFTWQMYVRGLWAVGSLQESTILGIVLYPFIFIAAIGFLMLSLTYFMNWLRALKETHK